MSGLSFPTAYLNLLASESSVTEGKASSVGAFSPPTHAPGCLWMYINLLHTSGQNCQSSQALIKAHVLKRSTP